MSKSSWEMNARLWDFDNYFAPVGQELREPHVCGLGGEHYGVCPACEEVKEGESE
jgi:hypothetical protein